MANTRSAKKQIRVNERKRLRNRAVRSSVRTKVSHTRRALAGADAASIEQELKLAVQALDQAAQKGIVHKRNAARRKARLMTQVHARLLALASAPAAAESSDSRKPAAAKTAKKPAATKSAAAKTAATKKPAAKKTAATKAKA